MSASKAHEFFLEKQKQLRPGKQIIELKRLIETCWACRRLSIVAVCQTLGTILSTLKIIINGNDSEEAVYKHMGYCKALKVLDSSSV